jgi:uridylate kinase
MICFVVNYYRILKRYEIYSWRQIKSMRAYERVLLKLSGEALAGEKGTGFYEATCITVAKQVKQLVEDGIQVSIVIGGGNFWRGRTSETIDRTKADQIGMLATVMNCIYVSEIFRHVGMSTEVYTPFSCGGMTKLFSKDSVIDCMKQGGVAFLAGGTGHPYFSTDTATVLRAIELECDTILMARAVDGVYDSDPKLNPSAKKFDEIALQEVLDKKLGIVDLTATVLCIENKMPILLFGLAEENSIVHAAQGKSNGTRMTV